MSTEEGSPTHLRRVRTRVGLRRMREIDKGARLSRHRIARGTMKHIQVVIAAILASLVFWFLFGAYILPNWFHARAFWTTPVGLVATIGSILVYLNIPGWATIGKDGVLIDWRGNDRRFVSFEALESTRIYTERQGGKQFIGVELLLRAGEAVRVLIGENQFGADNRAAALETEIAAAHKSYQDRTRADEGSMLERGDRSPTVWLTRLRSLASGANAGPREAAVPQDRLWRIVEDPGARAEWRAAAAMALAGGDASSQDRLRIAASETAAPKLRIALESAASGDEESMTEALAAIERETEV